MPTLCVFKHSSSLYLLRSALWFSMFPWAKFRRSGGEDCDDEAQHSDVRAAPKAEEKTDYGMTKVQIWRGDAKLGSNQWETMEDLTDVRRRSRLKRKLLLLLVLLQLLRI